MKTTPAYVICRFFKWVGIEIKRIIVKEDWSIDAYSCQLDKQRNCHEETNYAVDTDKSHRLIYLTLLKQLSKSCSPNKSIRKLILHHRR